MNQPTHAWLAVEAYREIDALSRKPQGQKKKLDGLAHLLGANLRDVVVAAWLPDSLIKDMDYGHVFKNSIYEGDQVPRFTLSKKDLKKHLATGARTPKAAFDCVPDDWWTKPYRVKLKGGHLPTRVNALCQTARDMFKMGDDDVVALTGIKPKGAMPIAKNLLFSPRDIATTLWMASHYIADAHMPFHCDNRGLAAAKKQTHCQIEDKWGEQVPAAFHSGTILKKTAEAILATPLPDGSQFAGIDFGDSLSPLKNGGDPWKECVYICRASFATSFAWVPSKIAPVDDQKTKVSLKQILDDDNICGEDLFWDISRAIMADAANAIARFWQDAWCDFVTAAKKPD
jgi:hypothetical protein